METIGFIGIGNMGSPMALNLSKAGFPVVVYDVNTAKAVKFAADNGVSAASGLADLGARCSIVVTMLPDGHVVRKVMLGAADDGLAAHLKPGALVIDMSSADPIGTRELGGMLKGKSIDLIDAPVSGGVARAHDGTLTIMVGGDEPAAIERAKPVLAGMGKQIFETGPLGSGHAMKALNNYVAAAGFAAASEALIVGERFGLDQGIMVDIMRTSTGRNFATDVTLKPHVVEGAFASGFALALLAKDVKIAADLAEGLSLDMPLARTTSKMWLTARDDLEQGVDNTAAYKAWKARASR
ncbi:Probable 6-phosphogluconate dehydrogenase protein [Polymorphum gilvum SL003B-26A1]|uniref:Probable 6-phosphogluconate dehydrogenase protein n=2 Tax=Polymorphum TaxID=991903 RepID=F2IXH4_POLGS|nr:Probable 6-phosphogluconate dehydrogenase protein [Polymorphum gilvum SL003B-26A1]